MKKLGKKYIPVKETIESYACTCSIHCDCWCNCNGVITNQTGTPGTEKYSHHYSPWYSEMSPLNSQLSEENRLGLGC